MHTYFWDTYFPPFKSKKSTFNYSMLGFLCDRRTLACFLLKSAASFLSTFRHNQTFLTRPAWVNPVTCLKMSEQRDSLMYQWLVLTSSTLLLDRELLVSKANKNRSGKYKDDIGRLCFIEKDSLELLILH